HDSMRRRFTLAGGANADEAGLFAELSKVGGAEVAHARLNAADQLGEDAIHGAGHFLQGFDAFGGDFARRIGGVAIAGSGAGFHGRQTAHATVLFVNFATDLHYLTRSFRAAGQYATANDGLSQSEGFDYIAR